MKKMHLVALLAVACLPARAAFMPSAGSTLLRHPLPSVGSKLLRRPVRPCCTATAPRRASFEGMRHSHAAKPPSMLFGRWGAPAAAPVPRLRSSLLGVGWISWWSQVILSTISGVLLLFANSVTARPTAFTLVGRALALAGLAVAFASTLWTVGYARLAAVLAGDDAPTAAKAAERASGLVRVAVSLNVLGMVLCILAAEAIVGTLAAKALTQTTAGLGVAVSTVQPLDLLIVQANTNTIAAHFISLCSAMRLRSAAATCAAAVDA